MTKTIAYIRTSTDKQDLDNQRLQIYEYARLRDLKIDEFVDVIMSSRKNEDQRKISELLNKLENSDSLVVTELSRLGRSTAAVIELINQLIKKNVRIMVIKQNLDMRQHDMNSKVIITMFSLFSELERDMISCRTKEALAVRKSQGITLGKPKGIIQKSKFDAHVEKIKELLKYGLSVRKIAKVLGYSNHISLNTYLKKRNIKQNLQPIQGTLRLKLTQKQAI
jgi:DNA invertase Pin-like site-specific DNA recombinase